jgi:hypothetical protein
MAAPWTAGAQARIIGTLHGQQTVNVLHFATNDEILDQGSLDTLLLQLAQALLDCAISTLLPAVTIDWTLVKTDAKRIYPTPSDPIIATAPAGSEGDLGAASVSFASSLMSVRTGGGGRQGRGRIFLPPAGEAQTANSLVDGPTLVLLAAFASCLAGKFMGASPTTAWRLGVYSRTHDAATGGTFDNSFRVATQLSPVAAVAVMRSRRVGHGA